MKKALAILLMRVNVNVTKDFIKMIKEVALKFLLIFVMKEMLLFVGNAMMAITQMIKGNALKFLSNFANMETLLIARNVNINIIRIKMVDALKFQ